MRSEKPGEVLPGRPRRWGFFGHAHGAL